MANRYIGPGKSLPWLNDTGRDAASGEIVPFGGGRAAIAEHDIPAGTVGQVTMSNVWLIDAPDGLAIAKGDTLYAADGKLAAEGDVLGIAVSPVLRGKVRVKLCPCAGAGGGDPTPPTPPTPTEPVTLWSNAADIAVMAPETVTGKSKVWTWAPQTREHPECFDVPASIALTALETLNEITDKWQDVSEEFDVSDAEHDGAAYRRYTDNRGYRAGERQIRITWR